MIVGITGKARSGKDTAALTLILNLGFIRLAFADSLKAGLHELLGLTHSQLYGDDKDVVDPFWGESPRSLLQTIGTDILRKHFRDDVFTRAWERRLISTLTNSYKGCVVVPDVRFPNEAACIRAHGGKILRITRLDHDGLTGAAGQHSSETMMEGIAADADIAVPSGALSLLRTRTISIVREWLNL